MFRLSSVGFECLQPIHNKASTSRCLITFLALILSLLITSPASSANFQQGLDAYNKDDYVTALKHWVPLAEQGNAGAQSNLGFMYGHGQGVPQDDKTAVHWYRLAAEQGFASAQNDLGAMYSKGSGVPKDVKTAFKWYRLAAEQGIDAAQTNLGLMYVNGRGIPQDYKTALKWLTRAAEQGFAPAQHTLGALYANGWGVPQDFVPAHMWLNIAASNGESTESRDQVAQMMTPTQLEEAQWLAREWVKNHSYSAGVTVPTPYSATLNLKGIDKSSSVNTPSTSDTWTLGAKMTNLYGEPWALGFFISLVFTWVFGLAPPLFIRFAMLKKPMAKLPAIGLVAGLLVFNLAVFIALGSQTKTHIALYLIALASYWILRKGAKKQTKPAITE